MGTGWTAQEMSAGHCKHCETPLEAMWTSDAACEPGGGLANAFVLLMASAAVAFAASGFQDEIFFSLGGGVLVWLLGLEFGYVVLSMAFGLQANRGVCCFCAHQGRGSTKTARVFLWSCKTCRKKATDGKEDSGRGAARLWLDRQDPIALIGIMTAVLFLPLAVVTVT